MPNLYGQKLAGYDERQQYRDASMGVGQLNQRSPAITARAPGEALSARLGNIQMGRQLEDDTFRVRGAQAQMAYQNVQNRGAQLGYQALQDAQRTGNWDMYNNRLQDIAAWQNQATQGIGARSMQQFGAQTLSNFGRRVNLGNLMTAANTQNAEQIMNWAKIALGVQQQDREFAMDQRRYADDLAYRDRAFQERALDRQDDQTWRQMQYDRQVQNDQYDQEDTLVRRGHSPEAVQAYLNGDRSLVDTELKQGLSEVPGLSRRTGLSGGRRGELSAEDQVYMKPADNDALIRRKLKQDGFDTVFMDAEGKPDQEMYGAFQQQLPVSYEKTGNKDEAIRDAIRTVAPERYGLSVVTGMGITPGKTIENTEALGANVTALESTFVEQGMDPNDAKLAASVHGYVQTLSESLSKSGKFDSPQSAMEAARSIFQNDYPEQFAASRALVDKYTQMDASEQSQPSKNELPKRTRDLENDAAAQQNAIQSPQRKAKGRISFGKNDSRYGAKEKSYGYEPKSNPDAQKKFLARLSNQRSSAKNLTDVMMQSMTASLESRNRKPLDAPVGADNGSNIASTYFLPERNIQSGGKPLDFFRQGTPLPGQEFVLNTLEYVLPYAANTSQNAMPQYGNAYRSELSRAYGSRKY